MTLLPEQATPVGHVLLCNGTFPAVHQQQSTSLHMQLDFTALQNVPNIFLIQDSVLRSVSHSRVDVLSKLANNVSLADQVVCATGAYTAKRYSLWQSRQAVLNAQLAGPSATSSNQLDTETAAADAIAALGELFMPASVTVDSELSASLLGNTQCSNWSNQSGTKIVAGDTIAALNEHLLLFTPAKVTVDTAL